MLQGQGVEGMNPDQVRVARSPDLEVYAMGGHNFQAAVMGGGDEMWRGAKHYISTSLKCHG